MYPDLTSSPGFRRYMATSTTAADCVILSYATGQTGGGRIMAKATLNALAIPVFPLGQSVTARIMFMGVGADGTGARLRVYGTQRLYDATGAVDESGILLQPIGGATLTMGTNAGITGGSAVLSTETFCDGITWTAAVAAASAPNLTGPQNVMETALSEGASAAFTSSAVAPHDIGMLVLPCLGRYTGLILDMCLAAASPVTSINALICTDEI